MRFRIRSARRDESSDAKRLGSIERSIQNAISDIESEKDGLARRLKDARDSASVYVGSEASEYLDREESVEKELSASEQVLVSAAQRLRQLNAQLEHLHRVLDVLKQK
jgi:chromosome segregation ATPase